MVGGLYQVLAKVLANGLKKVVRNLVLDFHHAFVVGRQILDVLANEAIDFRLKGNLKRIICKLDVEKTYDHVNWNYVLAVVERMMFSSKWIRWIGGYISRTCFYVLVNGSLSSFFQSSKGLRQDDCLSPYLFILAMKTLHTSL